MHQRQRAAEGEERSVINDADGGDGGKCSQDRPEERYRRWRRRLEPERLGLKEKRERVKDERLSKIKEGRRENSPF